MEKSEGGCFVNNAPKPETPSFSAGEALQSEGVLKPKVATFRLFRARGDIFVNVSDLENYLSNVVLPTLESSEAQTTTDYLIEMLRSFNNPRTTATWEHY